MPAITDEQRRNWEEQGFLIVRNSIDAGLIKSIRDAVESIIDRALDDAYGDSFRWVDKDRHLPDFINDLLTAPKYVPTFGALLDTVILPFVESLLNSPVRCSWLMTLTSGAGHAYGVPLHRDNCGLGVPEESELIDTYRMKQAYFQAPLLPGDRFLQLVPGSHLRLASETEIRTAACDYSGDDPPGLKTIELEPGDIVYRHTNTLHRGQNPEGIRRLTLASSFWAASMPLLDIERQDFAGLDDPDFVKSLSPYCQSAVGRYLHAYAAAGETSDRIQTNQ